MTIVMVASGSPVFYLHKLVNQARFYSRSHAGAWSQLPGSMPMKNPFSRLEITEKTWLCLLLICIINMLVFIGRVLSSAPDQQVLYIPDDGFYYLVLARNFARLWMWTFDSGVSLTSGFHPMLAYLLAIIHYCLNPGNQLFITASILLTAFITFGACLVALKSFISNGNWQILAASALVISSPNFTFNSVTIMEWPLVVLFSALYARQIEKMGAANPAPAIAGADHHAINAVSLFFIAFLGSLSRTDFGLIPLAFFLASFIIYLLNRFVQAKRTRTFLLPLLSGLAGSIVATLLIFLHNYIFSGSYIQYSAKMKLLWSQNTGPMLAPIQNLIWSVVPGFPVYAGFGLHPVLKLAVILTLIALSFWILVWAVGMKRIREIPYLNQYSDARLILFIGSNLAILGYSILYYMHPAAIQPWYSANLIAPIVIGISGILIVLDSTKIRIISLAILSGLIIRNITTVDIMKPRWPNQYALYQTGIYLAENMPNTRIGSWNSGIINFYQGGKVVNLDGLVNNDIYQYAITDSLPCYLIDKRIIYLADHEIQFERYLGGTSGSLIRENITLVHRFNMQLPPHNTSLYKINLATLESQARCGQIEKSTQEQHAGL